MAGAAGGRGINQGPGYKIFTRKYLQLICLKLKTLADGLVVGGLQFVQSHQPRPCPKQPMLMFQAASDEDVELLLSVIK